MRLMIMQSRVPTCSASPTLPPVGQWNASGYFCSDYV